MSVDKERQADFLTFVFINVYIRKHAENCLVQEKNKVKVINRIYIHEPIQTSMGHVKKSQVIYGSCKNSVDFFMKKKIITHDLLACP